MASTIPYDPTLVIGNLVDPSDIDNLKVISENKLDTHLTNLRNLISDFTNYKLNFKRLKKNFICMNFRSIMINSKVIY